MTRTINEARTCRCAFVAAALALGLPSASATGRAAATKGKGAPMKEQLPWYHSADEISAELNKLVGQCGDAEIEVSQRSEINTAENAGTEVRMDVVRLSKSKQSSGDAPRQPKTKALLVFGEHARELISPESALHFVKTLCGTGPSAQRAASVLDHVEFTIVPNSNPISRKLVEDGNYCKRTNEDNVDLNRNFGDAHREADGVKEGDERYPGPSGFSEPESRIVKGLVDEIKPDIYVSVHSGAYLLGTPFGYTEEQVPQNEPNMMEVLEPISKKYCGGNCPYGNLAKLIHYENPGCDIDYVAESGTPYVFTWEIYVGEDYREPYIEEAKMQRGEGDEVLQGKEEEFGMNLAQVRTKRMTQLAKRKAAARSRKSGRSGQQLRAKGPEEDEEVSNCMHQFNPVSEEETNSVLSRWTGAYLELAEEVSARQAKKQQQLDKEVQN